MYSLPLNQTSADLQIQVSETQAYYRSDFAVVFYLSAVFVVVLLLLSRYTPRKSGLISIFVGSHLIGLYWTNVSIIQWSTSVLFAAFSILDGSSSFSLQYNPFHVLLMTVTTLVLILNGLLLLFAPKHWFREHDIDKHHIQWLNLFSINTLLSLFVVRFLFYVLGPYSISLHQESNFVWMRLSLFLVSSFLLILLFFIKEPKSVSLNKPLTMLSKPKDYLFVALSTIWMIFCVLYTLLNINTFTEARYHAFIIEVPETVGVMVFLCILILISSLTVYFLWSSELSTLGIALFFKRTLHFKHRTPVKKSTSKIIKNAKTFGLILMFVFPLEFFLFFTGIIPSVMPSNLDYNTNFGNNVYFERNVTITNCDYFANGTFVLSFNLSTSYLNMWDNVRISGEYLETNFNSPPFFIDTLIFDLNLDFCPDLLGYFSNCSFQNGQFGNTTATSFTIEYSYGEITISAICSMPFISGIKINIALGYTVGDNTSVTMVSDNYFTTSVLPT